MMEGLESVVAETPAYFSRADAHLPDAKKNPGRNQLFHPLQSSAEKWRTRIAWPQPHSGGDVVACVLLKSEPPMPLPCACVKLIISILEGGDAPVCWVGVTHHAVEG